jgi:hypothetical protein
MHTKVKFRYGNLLDWEHSVIVCGVSEMCGGTKHFNVKQEMKFIKKEEEKHEKMNPQSIKNKNKRNVSYPTFTFLNLIAIFPKCGGDAGG